MIIGSRRAGAMIQPPRDNARFVFGSRAGLGQDWVSEFWWARRAGGADAQGAGRGATLDRRRALLARAQLLHAAAGAGGAAACHVHWLADAQDARRRRGWRFVRA